MGAIQAGKPKRHGEQIHHVAVVVGEHDLRQPETGEAQHGHQAAKGRGAACAGLGIRYLGRIRGFIRVTAQPACEKHTGYGEEQGQSRHAQQPALGEHVKPLVVGVVELQRCFGHFMAGHSFPLQIFVADLPDAQPGVRLAYRQGLLPEGAAQSDGGVFRGLFCGAPFVDGNDHALLYGRQRQQGQAGDQREGDGPQCARQRLGGRGRRCAEPEAQQQQRRQRDPTAPAAGRHAGDRTQQQRQPADRFLPAAGGPQRAHAAPGCQQQCEVAELDGIGIAGGPLPAEAAHLPQRCDAGADGTDPAAPVHGSFGRPPVQQGRHHEKHEQILQAAIQPEGVGDELAVHDDVQAPHQPHEDDHYRPGPHVARPRHASQQNRRPAKQAEQQQQHCAPGITRGNGEREREQEKYRGVESQRFQWLGSRGQIGVGRKSV